MKALEVIISPVVTEKATKLGEKFTYLFYVDKRATKVDVKMAIKELYGHDVARVKMMVMPEKTRVMRRAIVNKRPIRKKAIVTMKGGKKLDITKMTKEATKK